MHIEDTSGHDSVPTRQVSDIELPDVVRAFPPRSLTASTVEAYTVDLARFSAWCQTRNVADVPATPETVAIYITENASQTDAEGRPTYSASTIARWVSAINTAHRWAGLHPPGSTPTVESALAQILRTLKLTRPPRHTKPLLLDELRTTLAQIPTTYPDSIAGRRDKALLLIGFGAALRCDLLTFLTAGDTQLHVENGLHVQIRRSQSDEEDTPHMLAIPFGRTPLTCAPCAFADWITILATTNRAEVIRALLVDRDNHDHVCGQQPPPIDPQTPLFPQVRAGGAIGCAALSTHSISLILRRRMAAANLDPTGYSGRSLRAGFLAEASNTGTTHHEDAHQDPEIVYAHTHLVDPLAGKAVTRLGL